MIPYQVFVSVELINFLKFFVLSITLCFVTWQIRKFAQHLDGRRELHHYVHQSDQDERPQLVKGEEDGATYYRRPLR